LIGRLRDGAAGTCEEDHTLNRVALLAIVVFIGLTAAAQAQMVDRVAAAATEERFCKNVMLNNPKLYSMTTQLYAVSVDQLCHCAGEMMAAHLTPQEAATEARGQTLNIESKRRAAATQLCFLSLWH
jgi:hypothetical protein